MAETAAAVLAMQDFTLEIHTYAGPVQALTGVSLHVAPNEIVGLVGESGSGKSVTAMSAIRLLPPKIAQPTRGSVVLLGRDILRMSERALEQVRGKAAAMVFQEPMTALNPTIRIGRQITQMIRRHDAVSTDAASARAAQLLRDMRIADPERVMRSYPFELSGGMRQRVLMASAFACNPRLIIADEPTTALDVTVQAQVLSLLREQARAHGASVLFISHDLAVVAQLCERMYVMYGGRIVEEGRTAAVLRRPHHPYTRALLRSLPEAAPRKAMLATMPDAAPGLPTRSGCPFRPRCAAADDRCADMPTLAVATQAAHRVACWHPVDGPMVATMSPAAAEGDGMDSTQHPVLATLRGVEVHFSVRRDMFGRDRGHVRALNGIDLDIRRGETLGLVGESGCGKSTLVQVIMCLLAPTRGTLQFDGIDPWTLNTARMRDMRRRFQVVFQDPNASLDPRLPAWQIISEPLRIAGGRSRRELRAHATELAERVGLHAGQLDRYVHEFSGGQRQRIAIARALALRPDLVVLDEPTSALDVSIQAQILNLLLRLQRECGLSYLFISHNVSVVRHMADRVAVMYLGQIVELGDAVAVLEQPRHPYTKMLLDAVPKLTAGAALAAFSPAAASSNVVLPTGCFFRDRCVLRTVGCEKPQALQPLEDGRLVRCHLAQPSPVVTRHTEGVDGNGDDHQACAERLPN